MYLYDFRTFNVRVRFPFVLITLKFPYVFSTRSNSERFKYANDCPTFLVRVRFPNVLSTRTISVSFKYENDFRTF